MVLAKPTDDELRQKIRELVPHIDLQNTGLKSFMKQLSKQLDNVDLKPRKAFIRQELTAAINDAQTNNEEEEEEEESSDDEAPPAPAKKKSGKGGGLAQKKEISDKLAGFLGKGKMMARTDIVSELWEYIREHNLQNPDNKREILLDEAMQNVFDCETFTMFTMNKYISAHVHPFKPVDLTITPTKKRKKSPKSSSTKKRKTGTQPPYRLSQALQDVVGTDILPRPQVVSKLWEYIKRQDLQNPANKREILCDDKLLQIMKVPKISMFQMNTVLGQHLLEKVDKSEYRHQESDAASEEE